MAARGIDVEGVTHVINNTCPEDEKAYIHRIGRTGRAGASGIAVTFVDWADVARWKAINKALDLPYDEPQETYSTSPELYHDLGIPTDAKGRIKPAREPREDKPARDKRRTEERSERTEGGDGGERPARKRNRVRKRTRSGQTVDGVTTEPQVRVGRDHEDAGPADGRVLDRSRGGTGAYAAEADAHPEDRGTGC